jgi:hypothetical protein
VGGGMGGGVSPVEDGTDAAFRNVGLQ